ncbi:MAG: FG-GAP-like repeat-containing protein [Bryobacteraceae bacterium]
MASADFNGDGYPDLVITTGANAIQVLLADPANPGKFIEEAIFPAGIFPYAIALADLNGDGKTDVVVTNNLVAGGSSVGVMFADPNHPGQFLAPVMYSLSAMEGAVSTLAIGDLNGDGVPDLVVSEGRVQGNIGVLFGDPSHPGQFFSPVAYYGPGVMIFAEADVNGDGVPDLVMAPSQDNVSPNHLNILLGAITSAQIATLSNVALSGPGLHSLQANYQGSASAGASGGSLTVSVPTPTTTVLTINPSATALGSVVQLTAAVSVNGRPVVSGWVTFSEGNRILGTVSVQSNGQAVLKTGSFTSGAHQIVASYSGAPYSSQTVAASTSVAASLVVAGIPASVTQLTETANAVHPANVDLLATVLGLGFAPPTGAIAFSNPSTGQSLGTVPVAAGLFGFLAGGSYPAGSEPGMLVAGDFNGDGIQDLAINQFAGITVLLADPNHPGQFGAPVTYDTGQEGAYLTTADVNGDGLLDLMMANSNGNISVLLGDPQHPGQFLAAVNYPTGMGTNFLAVGDFNQDGLADIAVINYQDQTIGVLFQDPAHIGQFLPQVIVASRSSASSLVVGDFNRDGVADLAAADGGVSIYFGDPTRPGQFLAPVAYSLSPAAVFLAAGDFSGDGLIDLAGVDANDTGINVLLADPNHPGQFLAPLFTALASGPSSIRVADFNGDGLADVVIGGEVFLNDKTHPGQFLTTGIVPPGSPAGSSFFAVADFNADGIPDMVTSAFAGSSPVNTINVFFGATSATAALSDVSASQTAPQVLAAAYAGDPSYSSNVSNGVPAVIPKKTYTTISVTGNNTSGDTAFGSLITLAATVTVGQTPVTAGSVTFELLAHSEPSPPSEILGTVQIVNSGSGLGTATLRTTKLAPGGDLSIVAAYNGALGAAASTSNPVSFSVTSRLTPTLTLSASPNAVTSLNYDLTLRIDGAGIAPPAGYATIQVVGGGGWFDNHVQPVPTAPVTFLPATSQPAGNQPDAVVIADLNNDGVNDMAVANLVDNTVSVFLGDPINPGRFQPATNYQLAVGFGPKALAVGDFNGDGLLDLAVAGLNSTTILLSNSSSPGQFVAGATYAGGTLVTVADLDGDGLLDLVAGPSASALVNVLLGDPAHPGHFVPGAPAVTTVGAYVPTSLAVGDFNGDGIPDLAIGFQTPNGPVSNATGGYLSVLLGDSYRPGKFLPAANRSDVGIPMSVLAADFNGDGSLDLLINGSTILFGNLSQPGQFQAPVSLGTTPTSVVAIGDLNRDGIPDIAEVNSSSTVILIGDPSNPGHFLAPVTEPTTGNSLALGDFNGDAKPDLAITSAAPAPGGVSLLFSNSFSIATVTNVFLQGSSVPVPINATFADVNYALGFSNTLTLKPSGNFPKQIQLQASALSIPLGGTISFQASGGQLGTFTFYDGSTVLGTEVGNYQVPPFTVTFQTSGPHRISAIYDDHQNPSVTSNSITVNVGAAAPTGSISATPNPISVPLGVTVGVTIITWNSTRASTVEVHVGSPNGTLFGGGGPTGSAQTGQWVTDGMTFYLQDTSGGNPLTAAHTLATVVVHVVQQAPQSSFSANPNPITVPTGTMVGATTITWSAPQATTVELHVGSPTGTLFAGGGPTGSAGTGAWVTDGMTFYLQDTTGGKPLSAANTIATLLVHVVQQAIQASFSANPNPILVASGGFVGSTSLQWDAPGIQTVEVHVGSPTGILFAAGGASGSAQTGQWVTDGMTFYLQDTSDGKVLSAANTLATLVVHLQAQLLLTANPNPIPVGMGATVGSTTVSWNVDSSSQVEVHVGEPNGTLFAAGGSVGSAATGQWVTDGMTFYLQDVSGGKEPIAANTLGTLVVHLQHAQEQSASLVASPNPIVVSVGTIVGTTNIAWDAHLAQTVEIHVGSPSGPLFAAGGPTGSAATGAWVSNGMTFYLQDTTGGKPLTNANTLATENVIVQQQ